MKAYILIALTILITSCGSNKDSGIYLSSNQTFELKKPDPNDMEEAMNVWATNYFIPEFNDGSGDIYMRDINGNHLGPKLSNHDWCHSALEGSVKINFGEGVTKVFNYRGKSAVHTVDCSAFVSLDLSKSKFMTSKSEFGEGTASYNLVPFRTIAADPSIFPLGTVLYIPKARGNKIVVGDKMIIHDGYFFVADIGGAIKGVHIDVFIGIKKKPLFFPWIGHKASATFKIHVVNDPEITEALKKMHQKN
jgi:3D (Asp-Asp-Asp) domain-containing protein